MICGALLLTGTHASAEVLISPSEAAQPPISDARLDRRGVTRGPSIDQISPSPKATVHSPLELKIKFIAHNNANIDPAAVKVIYERETPIDLTELFFYFKQKTAYEMPDAEVPPGTHLLRVEVKDSLDRKSV